MSGRESGATLKKGVEELAVVSLRRSSALDFCFKSATLDLGVDNYHQRRDDGHVDGWCEGLF